jgi:hypothetical protein
MIYAHNATGIISLDSTAIGPVFDLPCSFTGHQLKYYSILFNFLVEFNYLFYLNISLNM